MVSTLALPLSTPPSLPLSLPLPFSPLSPLSPAIIDNRDEAEREVAGDKECAEEGEKGGEEGACESAGEGARTGLEVSNRGVLSLLYSLL